MNPRQDTQYDPFIDKLLEERQYQTLTPENRQFIVEDLRERIAEQVNRAIFDALPDEYLTQAEQLLASGEPTAEKLQQIIKASKINVEKIVAQTLVRFRAFYLRSS
jgi:hypothetical protein